MTFVCGWCLNTGARPYGKPEKPRWIPQERWDRLYEMKISTGRWIRCLACDANMGDKRTGPEIAAALSQDERLDILDSPTNRARGSNR